MRLNDFVNKDVYAEDEKIAIVKDVLVNPEDWQITHLEIELTKEAAKEIFGARTAFRNTLAITALEKGSICCTDKGVEVKVSKGQLHIYLRPL
jgi:sporulation protein YlmC with PRC-barrel domain